MVLRQGLAQVGLGLLLGLGLAFVTSRLLGGLLHGVTVSSPRPYIVVSSVLIAVALAACLAPARRAMRIDPTLALRAE